MKKTLKTPNEERQGRQQEKDAEKCAGESCVAEEQSGKEKGAGVAI